MKRLIKFRGKRTDIGEWIYGDLLTFNGTECEISDWNDVVYSRYDIDPETVGQFTGLLDKNGKEIYKGDIVMWGHLNDGWSNENPTRKAVVKLFPSLHFLAFTQTEFGTPYAFYYDSFAYKETHKYLEVIGNVYDSPELLKGGKE